MDVPSDGSSRCAYIVGASTHVADITVSFTFDIGASTIDSTSSVDIIMSTTTPTSNIPTPTHMMYSVDADMSHKTFSIVIKSTRELLINLYMDHELVPMMQYPHFSLGMHLIKIM